MLPELLVDGRPYAHRAHRPPAPAAARRARAQTCIGIRTELALALRRAQRPQPDRPVAGRRPDRHRRAPARPALDLRQALAGARPRRRASSTARGVRLLQLRHDLPARAAGSSREFAAGLRRDRRGRGEAAVPRGRGPRHPLRPARRPGACTGKRDADGATAARRPTASSTPTPSPRALAARLLAHGDVAVGRGAGAPRRRPARPRIDAAAGCPHAVLLLGLPAQQLDQGARGRAGRRRHRLPRDGAADGPRAGRRRSPG